MRGARADADERAAPRAMAEPPVKTSAEAKLDDIQAKLQEALRLSQAAEEALAEAGVVAPFAAADVAAVLTSKTIDYH